MIKSIKISVIIPVFNGEKYIDNCLTSIINQKIDNEQIEIIIINDGSVDTSKKIIDQYLKKYKNIKYIEQKNSGQGKARNVGLKKAKGKYISFVDCDDTIEPEMYKILLNEAEKNDYDIVTCDYNIINKNSHSVYSFRFVENENKNFVIMNTGPCNMIIRRETLLKKHFSFLEGIIYEDFACIPPLAIETKIKHLNIPLYNYYKHDNSTMIQKEYSHKLEDIFIAFENLEKEMYITYPQELEFLFIKNIMMSASLRFIEFKDPNNQINKISKYAKEKYPKWRKNIYYKKLNYKKKIVALLTYYRLKKVLYVLFLMNRRKRK